MKTTIDISDGLLARAKRLATKRRTTIRALVEEGLRNVLKAEAVTPFELRDASFHGGTWLQDDFRDADWQRIIDASYEGRGT